MIKKLLVWLGFGKKPNSIDPELKHLLDTHGVAWELFVDGILVGFFKNPSKAIKNYPDLKPGTVYYHVNKYGTFKKDKYELVCRKS